MKLTGNTILVTGGTSGIGRGLAEALHDKGNKVIIAGRRQNLLDEITSANPGMKSIRLDVEDAASIKAMVETVRRDYPELNVVFNNAGIARYEDYTADSIDMSASDSIINTNITSVLHITAELLPLLRKQKSATIVTTTSGLAFVPLAMAPTYSATKAFLHSWLQSLRFQLKDTAVEILELAPPYVQTELGGKAQAEDPAAMPLAEYVAEVMSLLGKGNEPDGEVLVERVKELRWAIGEKQTYEKVFAGLNSQKH